MKLDWDPFLDKQEWEDRPAREAKDVADKHEATRLDKKLKNRSFDNRKLIVWAHTVVGGLIVLGIVLAVVWVVISAFKFAFM